LPHFNDLASEPLEKMLHGSPIFGRVIGDYATVGLNLTGVRYHPWYLLSIA
jgi:hypothetical protein